MKHKEYRKYAHVEDMKFYLVYAKNFDLFHVYKINFLGGLLLCLYDPFFTTNEPLKNSLSRLTEKILFGTYDFMNFLYFRLKKIV